MDIQKNTFYGIWRLYTSIYRSTYLLRLTLYEGDFSILQKERWLIRIPGTEEEENLTQKRVLLGISEYIYPKDTWVGWLDTCTDLSNCRVSKCVDS